MFSNTLIVLLLFGFWGSAVTIALIFLALAISTIEAAIYDQ